MLDLLGKAAPAFLEAGILGAIILVQFGAIAVMGWKINSQNKAIVASHDARIADHVKWGEEKTAIIKEQIEADHEVATGMQTIATAFNAVKDVVGSRRR
jgi:hypothetical protein